MNTLIHFDLLSLGKSLLEVGGVLVLHVLDGVEHLEGHVGELAAGPVFDMNLYYIPDPIQ